jgi:hypothetical protein
LGGAPGRAELGKRGGRSSGEVACAREGAEVTGWPAGEEGRPQAEEPRKRKKKESDGGGREE